MSSPTNSLELINSILQGENVLGVVFGCPILDDENFDRNLTRKIFS